MAMLALRAGGDPRALITTTPRRVKVLRRILAEATTVQTTDNTDANQAYLPPEFIAQIVGLHENTRLGRQEIYAEFLETTEGVWLRCSHCRQATFIPLSTRPPIAYNKQRARSPGGFITACP
jgi:phage terminase large subunit-like protein